MSSLSKQRKKGTFGTKYQITLIPKLKTPKSKVVSFLAKKERRGQRKRPFGINSLLAVKHNIMLSQSRQMWTYSTTTLKAVESIFFFFSLVWTGLDWAGSPPHDGQFSEIQFDFKKVKIPFLTINTVQTNISENNMGTIACLEIRIFDIKHFKK